MVALVGALALALPDRRPGGRATSRRVLVAAISIALVLGLQFSLYRIMDRFGADPLADARIPFARNTIAAAKASMPWGSGLGSFVPVYAMTEPPRDVLADTFANHAHNDVLELWLETGAVGLVILAAVALWWLLRVAAVWRPTTGQEIDGALARVGTIVIVLLIGHSVVDYPLRTNALMAVVAFAAALTVPPPTALRETRDRPAAARGKASDGSPQAPTGPPGLAGLREPRPAQPWGQNVQWPEAWRQPSSPPRGPGDGSEGE